MLWTLRWRDVLPSSLHTDSPPYRTRTSFVLFKMVWSLKVEHIKSWLQRRVHTSILTKLNYRWYAISLISNVKSRLQHFLSLIKGNLSHKHRHQHSMFYISSSSYKWVFLNKAYIFIWRDEQLKICIVASILKSFKSNFAKNELLVDSCKFFFSILKWLIECLF